MAIKIVKNSFLFLLLLLFSACSSEIEKVRIHTQVWTLNNLNVAVFANGDDIPEAKTDAEWTKAANEKKPVWCYYNNNPVNGEIYGKLYNFYVITDKRGIAPKGWHVPRLDEWKILIDNLGGPTVAGLAMKDTIGWENGNGTNESGFASLPSGYRNPNHQFYLVGQAGGWWSATTSRNDDAAWAVYNSVKSDAANMVAISKSNGAPIRLIKD